LCLAEALLRIPDAETADDLIADKLSGPDWAEKMGDSRSTFVNARTFFRSSSPVRCWKRPMTSPTAGVLRWAALSAVSASR
jgi:hypothetical protein